MSMNAKPNGTPVGQLKLDEGPLTIVPRTIRLRDEPPLAVKRADDRPDDGPSHYTTFCDRSGRVLSTDRPDGVPSEADRALDAIVMGKAGQAFTEAMCSGRAPDAFKPPKCCDLRNHVSGDRDVDARYTIPGASPFDGEGLDAADQSERWTVANAETPGGTFADTDAGLNSDDGSRARRASRQRAYERLQDELELVAEIREQAIAECEAAVERRCLDGFRAVKAEWRRKALRRLAGACTCVFVLGLAIGAMIGLAL
jgi:hypothetical protein